MVGFLEDSPSLSEDDHIKWKFTEKYESNELGLLALTRLLPKPVTRSVSVLRRVYPSWNRRSLYRHVNMVVISGRPC